MKVFGVGLSKTGTTTLATCLEKLGFRHFGWDRSFSRDVTGGDFERLWRVADTFDSFDDLPWPALYRVLDEHYPDAKFVLTRRRSADEWYRSLCRHAEWKGPTRVRERYYGYLMPHGRRAEHVAFYEAHNRAVIDHFAGRPGKLLVACWQEEASWTALCDFLGASEPDAPFPHENRRRRSERAHLTRRVKYTVLGRLDLPRGDRRVDLEGMARRARPPERTT